MHLSLITSQVDTIRNLMEIVNEVEVAVVAIDVLLPRPAFLINYLHVNGHAS